VYSLLGWGFGVIETEEVRVQEQYGEWTAFVSTPQGERTIQLQGSDYAEATVELAQKLAEKGWTDVTSVRITQQATSGVSAR
jgi:hypothetical protein